MNADFLDYIRNFMDRIGIPLEARNEILEAEKKIFSLKNISAVFEKYKTGVMNRKTGFDEALAAIGALGGTLGISVYTLHFIFLINCTDILRASYKKRHIDEQIFWDTMDDFRCKLLECREVKGVWGTFVPLWYAGFLHMERFALGRFQYEERQFEEDTYKKNGIILNKGDKVYNFHIPASGGKFDRAARLESYRRAYEFYGYGEKGGIMFLVCCSWLLYKGLRDILPPGSNILDFMNDFDIVSSTEDENFGDGWRVFGKHYGLPPEQLPTDTSLRRAIAGRLSSGGKMGTGFGIIVFDGNKIIK